MTIQLIRSLTDFQDLKEIWNDLLASSASHVPFLRHEYLSAWWQTLGGGEWESGELTIVLERNRNGHVTGIAPLFISANQVMLLGSHQISDYLDLICPPDHLEDFTSKLLHFLYSDSFPPWEKLVFYNLPENSPTPSCMERSAARLGWRVHSQRSDPAPFVKLPVSWEAYLNLLEDRYRQEVERKLRKAESYFLPVSWYITKEWDKLDQEMDAFLELMANRPDKKAFLTSGMIGQMKLTARAAFQDGWLQLAFLVVGDLKVAGYLNFDYGGKILIYNSGYNPLFENISPGWVLLCKIIQQAIQRGKSEIDFMRGDEPYKYQFGGKDRNLVALEISPQ
jgi:CelD/BcsL family acetyltransferase involved in cellulose biosynthesis